MINQSNKKNSSLAFFIHSSSSVEDSLPKPCMEMVTLEL